MANYPLPKFHFSVDWGGTNIGFTEVTGLTVETESIDYRQGSSPEYNKTKQPGLKKYGNITLKRGSFKSDNEYFKWWQEAVNFQTIERRTVIIKMLGEDHAPVITWKVRNAWALKVQSADLKADANEIAIESIELAHEGYDIEFN